MNLQNLLTSAIDLAEHFLPKLGKHGADVGKVVAIVRDAAPVVAKEYRDLKPRLSGIIDALTTTDKSLNRKQLEDLVEAQKTLDAEFDKAAAKAESEDGASGS